MTAKKTKEEIEDGKAAVEIKKAFKILAKQRDVGYLAEPTVPELAALFMHSGMSALLEPALVHWSYKLNGPIWTDCPNEDRDSDEYNQWFHENVEAEVNATSRMSEELEAMHMWVPADFDDWPFGKQLLHQQLWTYVAHNTRESELNLREELWACLITIVEEVLHDGFEIEGPLFEVEAPNEKTSSTQ
jgi:hypothetical protein